MSTAGGFTIPADLRRRLLFTIGILCVYRLGVHVPSPGVDGQAVLSLFQGSTGFFGMFNTFTGGGLEKFSVFALGIMPYISASIIFQLLQTAVPYLESLKKEGEHGRKKINQYTRYATVLLALVQGYAMAKYIQSASGPGNTPVVTTLSFGPLMPFWFVTIVTLTAGTCFIMWLGEQITERGIGNGASLIIFTGIVAGIPSNAMNLYHSIQNKQLSFGLAFLLILGMVGVIAAIVYMEVGQRRIPIQYSTRASGREALGQQQSHLPLKVNFANVIPPIFASSLLMFPATIAQFVNVPWLKDIREYFDPRSGLGMVFFVSLIVFFCFFYTEIVFNPNEVADNLKKYGGFIPGVRAGRSTADYIKKVLDRLTVTGAIYLSVVCVLPPMISDFFKVSFSFGGTSLLILVGVALDTSQQIQSHLLTSKYEGMLKGVKMKSRRVQY